MKVQILYYFMILLLLSTGIRLVYYSFINKNKLIAVRFKSNRYREFSENIMESLKDQQTDNLFRSIGINISTFKYNIIRLSILLIMLLSTIYSDIISHDKGITRILIIVILILITAPQKEFWGHKTPFFYFVELMRKEYSIKRDIEIYRAITQLKNLGIALEDKPVGADFLINQLMRFTNYTKPVFAKTLSLWRLGKEEEACKYFDEAIGTKLSHDFSNILIKLDKINPAELVEQLVNYQERVKQEKVTEKLKRQEKISNYLYLPIIGVALAILLNFVVVVIMMDTMQAMYNL